ncbi:MAG: hypothetical protein IJC45_02875 [Clostridia bacterium]|nr:hypothetical protein [Clostridia bacterium]
MKKYVSLLLSILLLIGAVGLSACTDDVPELSDEQISEMNIVADYSAFVNFASAVKDLPSKTSLNRYSSSVGYLDDLLVQGQALKQLIEKQNLGKDDGVKEFEEAYEQVVALWDAAEEAAGKYVKGFYKSIGKKDVTAVYCYMTVNADGVNDYVFALTYDNDGTPVSVYMDSTVTSDIVEVSVYEDSPEKFYASECKNEMMNTPVYNNITLDLSAVLSAAK